MACNDLLSRILLPLLVISVPGSVTPASSEEVRLEAEELFTYGNIGQSLIGVVSCSDASGGHAIGGVDVPGEWIAWQVALQERTCFVDSLRTAGGDGIKREWAVLYIPDPPAETAAGDSTWTMPGGGVG